MVLILGIGRIAEAQKLRGIYPSLRIETRRDFIDFLCRIGKISFRKEVINKTF